MVLAGDLLYLAEENQLSPPQLYRRHRCLAAGCCLVDFATVGLAELAELAARVRSEIQGTAHWERLGTTPGVKGGTQ